MTVSHARRIGTLVVAACVFFSVAHGYAQIPVGTVGVQDPALAEARKLFDALDYERALPVLDAVIAQLEIRASEPAVRPTLANAFEMRARARFGVGDSAGARADFRAMLVAMPSYTLPAQVSPRVVALLNEVRKATVGTARVNADPPQAELLLDGVPFVSAGQPIAMAAGSHTLTGTRAGYTPGAITFDVPAGGSIETTLTLERVSATVSIVTTPPDVEVWVNGVERGRTPAGPPSPEHVEWASKLGVSAGAISRPLVLADIPTGGHLIEFRGTCLIRAERRIDVQKPTDYVMEPIKIERAVATVDVAVTQPNSRVFVDGIARGSAPMTLNDLCEGQHIVEVRGLAGRLFRRLEVRAGQSVTVEGTLTPAIAVLSSSGLPQGLRGGPDLRLLAERALRNTRTVTVFAPASQDADRAHGAEKLSPDWLAFDLMRRPTGGAANITPDARREISAKLARDLDVQAIAAVTIPTGGTQTEAILTILASGSGQPDIVELNLDRPDLTAASLARLDYSFPLFRPGVGLSAIDVLDVPGAVVIGVDPNGVAARGGIAPGDVIARANAQPINTAADLATIVAGTKAGDRLALEVRDRAGAPKKGDLVVEVAPRVISMSDQTLLSNKLVLDFRARLTTPGAPLEEAVTRLNLAVGLMRLGNWADARTELERVKLGEGSGVANGTVQYLMGLCNEALGDFAGAEQAWQVASRSPAGVTEDGPPVDELAKQKLAALKQRISPLLR